MDIFSRPFRGSDDLELLKEFIMHVCADTLYHSYLHIGDLLWSIYQNTFFDPYRNIQLWQTAQGDLLGFAFFDMSRTAFSSFIQVHPIQHENTELYDMMLHWLSERAAAGHREDPSKEVLSSVSYDDDIPLQQALLRHNFIAGDIDMWHFTRRLDNLIPEPILPAGWQVRPVAGENEWAERVAIHRDVWHPSRVTLEAYRRMRGIAGYHPQLDLVAVAPDGVFASYCICWFDPLNQCGEFEPVGTRASFRKQGIGKALIREGLRRLWTLGATSAIVLTNYGNDPARHLYESAGFQIALMDRTYTKHLTTRKAT